MKISNTINPAIISASINLLSPFVTGLTPTKLVAALQEYESDNKSEATTSTKRPYRISEVMQVLQLSKPSIYKLIRAGKLTRIKLGSATRITAASVEKLINCYES